MDARRDEPAAAATGENSVPFVSLFDIFKLFLMIGALSFGGGLIAWVYREVVEKRKWLTEQDFLGGLTLSQVLPGINMANISVYIGQRLRGVKGSLVAVFGLILIPFFFILALLQVYHQLIVIPGVQHYLDGMAVTAVGLFMSVGVKSARKVVTSIAPAVFILIIVVTVGFWRWPLLPVALALAPISVAITYYKLRNRHA
ncbi:MAG: hypothetical protein RLZ98_789 [Pseudomonadota bacterium]|jgi:chromate transporter